MVARYLVTTADERTWPTNQPVLFLGEWCRLFDKRHVWEKLDAVVAIYHWDDRKKLHQDYLYLQSLYESMLDELAAKLNEIHGVNHSVRYWRIFVGPWLGYFIQMVFDRWYMLQQVLRDNVSLKVRVIQRNENDLIPNDMDAFSPLFFSDDWNEMIFGQILEWMKIPVTKIQIQKSEPINNVLIRNVALKNKLTQRIKKLVNEISSLLSANDDYFFISSYFPFRLKMALQIKLGQIPVFWTSVRIPKYNCIPSARKWFLEIPDSSYSTDNPDYQEFNKLLNSMIPKHIPTAYLEGYKNLVLLADNSMSIKKPKALFTSNAHFSDEVFKVWAAAKVETGTPLIIGQHGGNYGIALYGFTDDHQIAISDRFLTWGWDEPGQKKVTPIGNFKDFGRRAVPDKSGLALMVEMTIPRYSYHMYSTPVAAGQWQEYFEEQCRFVQALPEALQTSVLVRLHSHDWGHQQVLRWRTRFPQVALDDGSLPMADLLKKTRIYISTYNATTYLESMSLNIPTIIFWNPKHWELRESAKPYFERLKAVGIFHETPEGAAQQMTKVWDDVADWWQSDPVQSARKSFCDVYAATPPDLMNRIKTVLIEEAKCSAGNG